VIAAATLLVAGCGISVASSDAFGEANDVPQTGGAGADASGGGANASGGFDAGPRADAAAVPAYPNGDPLCRVAVGLNPTCNPQDDNKTADGGSNATQQCLSLLDVDGGDAGSYACHVTKVNGGEVRPMCLPEGQSHESCVQQSSCSAGYECVGQQTGACHRYCCNHEACDSMSFCDVQSIFGAGDIKVPVCMPMSPCKLLADGCGPQTCSVVDEQRGATSCVDIGPRVVGQECETDHCAKDLVCLGTIGARKCFKLCDMSGASMYQCPPGEQCKANSVIFPGPDGIGICRQ
jgi:hypothetical protein